MNVDDTLRVVAAALSPDLGHRLVALLDAETGAAAVAERDAQIERQAALIEEFHRLRHSHEQQIDQLRHGSWFVATEEPHHENSVLVGVGRSHAQARDLVNRQRVAQGLSRIPWQSWQRGAVVTPFDGEAYHAQHPDRDDVMYQIVRWRAPAGTVR